MKSWSIGKRVTIIALLPALIMATLLSMFHARNRILEIENAVLAKARAVARHLAPASEFGVVSGNLTLLESIAASALQDEDFVRITIADRDDKTIVDRERADLTPQREDWVAVLARWLHPLFSSNELLVPVRATIYRIRLNLYDEFEPSEDPGSEPEPVGWIEIEVSLLDAGRNQLVVLAESLLLVLAALLAAAAAGRYVGGGVVKPVRAMTNAVRRITLGDLNARIASGAGGELGALERGINQMAERVEISRNQLRDEILKATTDLQATLAELEQRNLELDQARREAVKASDFKSQFLANVSHEIRTPMNAILGFTELLSKSSRDPAQREYLETILGSARSLLSLLNEILDLSKIESGRMQLEAVSTDLGNVMEEVYQLFLAQATEKGLEFFARPVEPELAQVLVDPLRLKQVLINLVSNAVKFTDRGHVLLRALVDSATPERLDIRFTVEDTGCGITPETQRKLFHAFSQGDMSTTRSHGGTGLGLHIASELVFMMGGEINVDSTPGKGTVFAFTLSLRRDPQRPPAAAPGEPRPVLLLNLYPPFAECLRELVRRAGFLPHTPEDKSFDPALQWLCALDCLPADAENAPQEPQTPQALGLDPKVPWIAWVAGGPEQLAAGDTTSYDGWIGRSPSYRATRGALLAALDPAGGEPRPTAGPPAAEPRAQGRVLAVDDHPLNLKLLRSLLEDSSYELTCIPSAPEALRLAERERFDLVLLDIHMPVIDGFELARELRGKRCASQDAVILALTADGYRETLKRALVVGMNDVLVKPVTYEDLVAALDKWMRPQSSSAALAEGEIFDRRSALNVTGGNETIAREMLSALVEALPMHRQELVRAFESGDRDELGGQVHKLRGATSYCGVPKLTEALAELQSLLKNGAPAETLSGQFDRSLALIDRILDQGARASSQASG